MTVKWTQLEAHQSMIPVSPGETIVPTIPTPGMIESAVAATDLSGEQVDAVWRAMLKATSDLQKIEEGNLDKLSLLRKTIYAAMQGVVESELNKAMAEVYKIPIRPSTEEPTDER